MPLISCPDCGNNQVSDQAPACPICGRPVGSRNGSYNPGRVQLVEQTGKAYKLGMLVGAAMMVGGCCTSCSQPTVEAAGGSVALGALGFIIMVVFRIAGWWHHG